MTNREQWYAFRGCRVVVKPAERYIGTLYPDGTVAHARPNYRLEDFARAVALGYAAGEAGVWAMGTDLLDSPEGDRMKSKTTILGQWTEVYEGSLSDKPPHAKRHEWYLFVNYVEAREKNGRRVLQRSKGVNYFEASDNEKLLEKVAEYLMRDSVRMLTPNFESNGDEDVPLREPLTDALLDGSADIYRDKSCLEAPGE